MTIPPPNDHVIRSAFGLKAGGAGFREKVEPITLPPMGGHKFDTSFKPKSKWLNDAGYPYLEETDRASPSWVILQLFYKPESISLNLNFGARAVSPADYCDSD